MDTYKIQDNYANWRIAQIKMIQCLLKIIILFASIKLELKKICLKLCWMEKEMKSHLNTEFKETAK